MVIIEPLGTGVILPAFVIGYEVPDGDAYDRVARWAASPDWVVALAQQAGGMAMRYPTVAGAVLRWADNPDRFRGDPDFLARGFRAMAEDPDLGLLGREYPVLRELVCTFGEDYSDRQLGRLGGLFERHLAIPPLESGFEAFVRLARCDLLRHFAGWRALHVTVLSSFREVYANQDCPVAEQSNLDGLELRSGTALDETKLRELEHLGSLTGCSELRPFLLWENAD